MLSKRYLGPDPFHNAVDGGVMLLASAIAARAGINITPEIQSEAARAGLETVHSVMGNRSIESDMLPADLLLYVAAMARKVLEVTDAQEAL